jgi:WD40 repeat protein
MWDLESKALVSQKAAHDGVVTSLARMEKDGVTRMLTSGADRLIKVWEPVWC